MFGVTFKSIIHKKTPDNLKMKRLVALALKNRHTEKEKKEMDSLERHFNVGNHQTTSKKSKTNTAKFEDMKYDQEYKSIDYAELQRINREEP